MKMLKFVVSVLVTTCIFFALVGLLIYFLDHPSQKSIATWRELSVKNSSVEGSWKVIGEAVPIEHSSLAFLPLRRVDSILEMKVIVAKGYVPGTNVVKVGCLIHNASCMHVAQTTYTIKED